MKWSILILTQPSRAEYLKRLLKVLQPQVAAVQGVDIEIRYCDFNMSVGDNRQIMREGCAGEYSNFIDDDDLVPDNYVESLLPLMDGVDFIGHKLTRFDDGVLTATVEHSLHHGGSQNSFHSTPHVNPVRTVIALKSSMEGDYGEDNRWWNGLRDLNLLKTENFLDEVMYLYMYRSIKIDGVVR